MAIAKAKGRLRGRQPKLTPALEKHLVELHHASAHTSAEIFGVDRSTVYRAIHATGARPDVYQDPAAHEPWSGVSGSDPPFTERLNPGGRRSRVGQIPTMNLVLIIRRWKGDWS